MSLRQQPTTTINLRKGLVTPDAIRRGNELCNQLPQLVLVATQLGMIKTARALQAAVQEVGYEQAENLKKVGKRT